MGVVHSHPEVERKYDAPQDSPVPNLTGVSGIAQVGGARTLDLVATYLDTLDLALARSRRVLRRRTGGSDEGWHVKLPGDTTDARQEILAGLGQHPGLLAPAELREILADVVGSAALVPVADVRTRRTERELLDGSGRVLALLVDDQVTTRRLGGWGGPAVPGTAQASARRAPQRWRELEVEVVHAAPGFLDEVTAVLVRAGFTQSASPSKLAQALGGAVRDAQQHVWGPGSTTGAVMLAYLAEQVGVLQSRAVQLRTDAPDAVHKVRVATRRLRSVLRTCAPLLHGGSGKRMRAELRHFARVLGGPRDAEVMVQRFVATLEETRAQWPATPREVHAWRQAEAHLITWLEERHAAAHADLVSFLDSARYLALMSGLVDFLGGPPWRGLLAEEAARTGLPPLLEQARQEVQGAMDQADAARGSSSFLATMHEVRKAAKRARYAAEAAQRALGEEVTRQAKTWEAVTENLGQTQDSTLAQALLAQLRRQQSTQDYDLALLDLLARHERAATVTSLERASIALAKASSLRTGRQLGYTVT